MASSRPIKGTELRTKQTLVPGAVYSQPSNPNVAPGQQPVPIVPPAVPDVDYGVIWLKATDGFTRNLSGTEITPYDLGDTNPAFTDVIGYSFPGGFYGGIYDENTLTWEIALDPRMDVEDPQISVRLHFLIPLYS